MDVPRNHMVLSFNTKKQNIGNNKQRNYKNSKLVTEVAEI